MNEKVYSIGGLKIKILTDFRFPCPPHVSAFLSEGELADIKVSILSDKHFKHKVDNFKIKYEDAEWFSVYENKNYDNIFTFNPDVICNITYMYVPSVGDNVEIYIDDGLLTEKSISIIETTPFLMCFMILLIRNGGIILHSSGISINDKGFVFCGKSGSGKTTISNLFKKTEYATLLTDEALILRKHGDIIRIYGSPWKGSGDNIYSNTNSLLEYIYFIYHGRKNIISEVDKHEAISILVKQAFPYFWDKKLMLKSFSLMTKIINIVPCSNLYFLPDQSVVSFIMKRTEFDDSVNRPIRPVSWYMIKKKYLDSAPNRSIKVKILSDSMIPVLMRGDEVQVKSVVYNKPKVGSIILFFHHHEHATIHRVISVVEHENKMYYRTKGDANEKKDYYLIPENEIIGVMSQ